MNPETLHAECRDALAAHADPIRAAGARAYLKTEQAMFGVPRPVQKRLLREVFARHPATEREPWEAAARLLWGGPERELQYAAIAWLSVGRRRFLTLDTVPLLEQLAREGAWWDLVDEIAAHAVGAVVARHREQMRPVLLRWIDDPSLWVRRTALLAQLTHRADTDVELLFDLCLRQAPDRSFWIRKAIGWALRQHARTDPGAVRAFLDQHGAALSGLSRREAAKHLG
ncbi:MAG: DNA alkylation repair protein [Myxococcota bacterium]